MVRLEIYDIMGRRVSILVNSEQEAGVHSIKWNGKDDDGIDVSSGIYFYKISVSNFTKTMKMLFIQ